MVYPNNYLNQYNIFFKIKKISIILYLLFKLDVKIFEPRFWIHKDVRPWGREFWVEETDNLLDEFILLQVIDAIGLGIDFVKDNLRISQNLIHPSAAPEETIILGFDERYSIAVTLFANELI